MRVKAVWIILLALAAATGIRAQAGELQVSAGLAEPGKPVTVGDPISLNVTLRYPRAAQPPVPVREFPATLAWLDEKNLELKKAGGMVTETRRVRLAVFATGAQKLGPFRYTAAMGGRMLEGSASAVPLTIRSVLKGKDESPSPPEPPRVIPYPTIRLVMLILAALMLLAGAVWLVFWLRRRRQARQAGKPRIPPFLEARDRLQALAARALPQHGEVRIFYFLASEIVKDYLGKELDVVVLERTSSEIRVQLPDLGYLAPETLGRVGSFLTDGDRVKFARYQPAPAEVDDFLRLAFDVVHRVHEEYETHRQAPPEAPEPVAEPVAQ